MVRLPLEDKHDDGVDYIAWEKYVQFEVMARFNRENRPGTRTMQLGCSTGPPRPPLPNVVDRNIQYDTIADAVRTVNGGLQLRPYIHPDCGGHHGPGAGGHTPQSRRSATLARSSCDGCSSAR